MKKSLVVYTEVDWADTFLKGDGWDFGLMMPAIYVNKEHCKNLNYKEFKKTKDKAEFWKTFKRIKITLEDVPYMGVSREGHDD